LELSTAAFFAVVLDEFLLTKAPYMACLHGAIVAAIGRATDRGDRATDRRDDRLV